MMLRRLFALVRRVWAFVFALAAFFGVQVPGSPPLPGTPPVAAPAPAPTPAVPAPPAKKVIGQCSTGDGYRPDGSKGFMAVCVVDGAVHTLPGDFPSRAAAQQAIRDFRAANP